MDLSPYPFTPFFFKHHIIYDNVCEGVAQTFANPQIHATATKKRVENKVMVSS